MITKFFSISIAFVMWTASAFSFEKYLDINLVTEIAHRQEKMHLDVNSEGAIPFAGNTFIVNPKLSLFVDGSMDVSVATGIRYSTYMGTFGHHIFWDGTSTKDGHFNQVGAGFDFLTDSFDYRINYYHPLTKEQKIDSFLSTPHKWIETEIVFKYPHFHVGVGPKYNLFEKQWGTQFKISFPFPHFNIETFVSHDLTNGFSGCLSFSFSLYSTPRSNYSDAPVSHRSRVQYSKEPIYTIDPQVTKKKDQKESVVVEKEGQEEDKDPSKEKDASKPVKETKESHWYDFFLTTN